MTHKVFALLVGVEMHPLESLREALREVPVETASASTCEKAARLMVQTEPSLIFTAQSISDGSWLDVLVMVERSGIPANVILVAHAPDAKLNVNAIERGAYDLVVPPFEQAALGHIVRSAWLDVQRRREDLARLEVA